MVRCAQCSRRVAARWRKCPFCRRWSGVPTDPRYPFLDRQLNSVRGFGIGFVVWLFVLAFGFLTKEAPWAVPVFAFAFVFLFAHVAVPWSSAAWRAAEVLWALVTLTVIALLAQEGWVLAASVLPASATAFILYGRKARLARLDGREPLGFVPPASRVPSNRACESCGSRDTRVVAPIYVVSFAAFSVRGIGVFRSLCPTHARQNALAAACISFCFGPWGLPWGFIWAAQAVHLDFAQGGVELESDLLRELKQEEATRGGLDDSTALTDFAYGVIAGGIVFVALVYGSRYIGL